MLVSDLEIRSALRRLRRNRKYLPTFAQLNPAQKKVLRSEVRRDKKYAQKIINLQKEIAAGENITAGGIYYCRTNKE